MYQKKVKALGFKVESCVSDHKVVCWVDFNARYTSTKLKSMRQAHNRFPGAQHKLKFYH